MSTTRTFRYELRVHDEIWPDYFQGWGTAFTDFTHACTGIGASERDALEDCLGALVDHEGVDVEMVNELEDTILREHNVSHEDRDLPEGAYVHVSVRFAVE